jgi:hypothetical protein
MAVDDRHEDVADDQVGALGLGGGERQPQRLANPWRRKASGPSLAEPGRQGDHGAEATMVEAREGPREDGPSRGPSRLLGPAPAGSELAGERQGRHLPRGRTARGLCVCAQCNLFGEAARPGVCRSARQSIPGWGAPGAGEAASGPRPPAGIPPSALPCLSAERADDAGPPTVKPAPTDGTRPAACRRVPAFGADRPRGGLNGGLLVPARYAPVAKLDDRWRCGPAAGAAPCSRCGLGARRPRAGAAHLGQTGPL